MRAMGPGENHGEAALVRADLLPIFWMSWVRSCRLSVLDQIGGEAIEHGFQRFVEFQFGASLWCVMSI